MPQVQLNNDIFVAAQRRAKDGGYASVDDYIAEVVAHDLVEDDVAVTPDLDHLFTPERLAHIDKAQAEIEAGQYFTNEQADSELAKRRAQWLQENQR